jgi:hypothetical protein
MNMLVTGQQSESSTPSKIAFSIVLPLCIMLWNGCASLTETPESGGAMTPEEFIESTASLADEGTTRLHPNYIWATLASREQDPEVNAAFELAIADGTVASRLALIQLLELRFIHDPYTSGLDILGPELSDHFRKFDWQENDFPGGPEGPNEQFADVMVDVLDIVLPERRANRSRTAVALRAEVTVERWGYITNQWIAVPEQAPWMLNRHACGSFVRMQEEAREDGVDLLILSAHRRPETARANAARAANENAVASFSSHSLGLAIDFDMSHREDIRFDGISTRPMSELVRMRQSPVHKWLVLRGHEFGWYPYQNEPWHWEYNPPGFREVYWAGFIEGAPERGIILDEP